MDAFVDKLNSKHIAYSDGHGKQTAIFLRADGVKQVYFNDPDGYTIEINDAKH
jgi:lactoylglutathione lyase